MISVSNRHEAGLPAPHDGSIFTCSSLSPFQKKITFMFYHIRFGYGRMFLYPKKAYTECFERRMVDSAYTENKKEKQQ